MWYLCTEVSKENYSLENYSLEIFNWDEREVLESV